MTLTARALATASVLALLAPAAVHAQAPAGQIQGRVTSAETGAPLAGARVSVAGSPVVALTDEAGAFTLTGVPAGAATVTVSYLGLADTSAAVEVAAGRAASLNIALGGETSVTVDAVVVMSQRIAQNDALNRYRNSDAIANYVAADDIGQFVDQNVAESLQRLPGVSITRDQGEGRFVSVRGVGAGLSTVTINGMRIGTPEDTDRAVPLDVIPSGSIDLLEIVKVPTPNMPGDAIGGSIDVRSGSPFNENQNYNFRYRLEGSYSELSDDFNPEARLNYTNLFSVGGGQDNLGVSLGMNYLDRNFESNNLEAAYSFNDDLGDDEFVIEEIQLRKYFVNRERFGANLNLEYRPTANDTFFANALFSRFTDAETRQRSIFVFEDGDLTSFDGETATFADIDEDGFRRRIRFRTKDQDTLALAFGGEHQRGLWSFDYRIGHSMTDENVPDEIEGRFENDQSPLDAVVRQGAGMPTFQILSGGAADTSYLDNANYAFDRVVLAPKFVDDDDTNLNFNVERADAFGVAGFTLSGGVDLRFKRKVSDVGETELRNVPDIRLDQFTTGAPDYPFHPLGDGISSAGFVDFFNTNRSSMLERPQDVEDNLILNTAEDYSADEDVSAGYLMGTWDSGPWRFIVGARVEHTEYSAQGSELNFDDSGDLTINPRSVESSYTNVLPGIHARFTPRDDLVIRAAWSNTIARPSFGDQSPRFEINNEDLEINMGNPDLEPYESSNLDLLLDWYPGGGSVMSVGVFSKELDSYIVERTFQNDADFPGFEVTRPVNGSDASIRGIELNLEQELGRWAPALDGFLIGANATLLDTEFTVDGRTETFSLPQAAEESANVYVGYEQGRFSGRVSYSFRGEYLEEIGDSREFDVYVMESQQLDLTASFRVNRGVELVFEAQNLLDDPLELYQGTPATTLQFEEYGATFAIGLKGRF